ncbi:MAG TPA: iron-containing alcohol dehydrogenase [Dehalococcoidia bacterium]
MTHTAPEGVFRFLPLERVIFGPGAAGRLAEEVARLGARRAFIVTGRSLSERTGLADRLAAALGPAHAGTFGGVVQHAHGGTVVAAAQAARAAGADCLVAFGGGSPIDAAKAVALALAMPDPGPASFAELIRAPRLATGAVPPIVAVPTTLSAAEFGGTAGLTDERTRLKTGFADPRAVPRTVILDPELTLATPRELWAASGVKALDHAVEGIACTRGQPAVHALCAEAIRRLFAWLPRSVEEPEDVAARGECQVAAWLSFFAPGTQRVGLSHALGHQIGARCDVPHGVTSCITLPHVMRYLAPHVAEGLASAAAAMGVEAGGRPPEEAARAGADAVAGLVARLGVPSRLRDAGVAEEDLREIAHAAFLEVRAREVPGLDSPAAVEALLRQMW